MKFPTTAVLIASAIALTAGCATQESVDKLQSEVDGLKVATATAQQAADGAAASANSANAAARQAQASADKSFGAANDATRTAKAAESELFNVDAKLDQMFKKLQRK